MEVSHNIIYEGLEIEVFGNYEEPEENWKGGWSTTFIKVNDIDIYWMLNQRTIDQITEIIIKENY